MSSAGAARDAILSEYCRELKTPALFRHHAALARQARESGWAYEEFLQQLLEVELQARRDHAAARRLREARFPELKTFEQLDWTALKGVAKPQLLALASGQYIEAHQDVILAGPIGTGKTHLAIALGVEAARRRYRVSFRRAADLVRELLEARDDRTLARLHWRYRRVQLLICDELGFVPFERAGGELLFNLLADRYERRSTIVTTNLAFSEWVQVFGDEKLTVALLDRLGHHAQVLTTSGESYRTRRLRQPRSTGARPEAS
jgi:DNA replication protein DnaC